MKKIFRFSFTLAIICALSAGFLSSLSYLTKYKIIAKARAEEDSGLKDVFKEAKKFEAVTTSGQIAYYKAFDKDDKLIGVVFKTTGKGYTGSIETMVGMLIDGTITAIKILNHGEAPGLGALVAEPSFTGQFAGKTDLSQIQAISGATVSSKAVIDSVKKKAEEIKLLIKNK